MGSCSRSSLYSYTPTPPPHLPPPPPYTHVDSLIKNWANEIVKWLGDDPDLGVVAVTGTCVGVHWRGERCTYIVESLDQSAAA
jgi:hypothetical protein